MKILLIALPLLLNSCAAMPELFKAGESVLTDDCITIKVDRDAFQKDTNVSIKMNVDVVNKDDQK